MEITRWDNLDLTAQKDAYEKQMLAWKFRSTKGKWARNYVRMARALADAFVEEQVLDLLEQTWWSLEYEGGSTWRETANRDPLGALREQFGVQHEGQQSLTTGPQDVSFENDQYEILHYFCYLKEVFLDLDERKIGISWCMGDAAAVRGLHPTAILDFANSQIRGDPYCYHIRQITDNPDLMQDTWSKELSEKIGWRSIKKLEE